MKEGNGVLAAENDNGAKALPRIFIQEYIVEQQRRKSIKAETEEACD